MIFIIVTSVKSKLLPVDIHTKNEVFHSMHHFSNLDNLKLIFGIENVLLTQTLRADIASYIINNYQEEIVLYLKERFDFIIVD